MKGDVHSIGEGLVRPEEHLVLSTLLHQQSLGLHASKYPGSPHRFLHSLAAGPLHFSQALLSPVLLIGSLLTEEGSEA